MIHLMVWDLSINFLFRSLHFNQLASSHQYKYQPDGPKTYGDADFEMYPRADDFRDATDARRNHIVAMATPAYYGSVRKGLAQPCPCNILRVSPIGLLGFLEFGLYFSGPQLPVSHQFIAISYFLSREIVFQSAGLDGSNMRVTCKIARSFPNPISISLSLYLYSPGCMAAIWGCILGQDDVRT